MTGSARYTVDHRADDLLAGAILRSPHAHARVQALDTSAAEALPGVHASHVFAPAGTEVRYPGQEIVALAADDETIVRRALRRVEVRYEIRDAAVDMAAAREEGAPLVYDRQSARRRAPRAGEIPLLPARWRRNVRGPFGGLLMSRWGCLARLRVRWRRRSDKGVLLEGRWRTQAQSHTTPEPHSCVASWDGPDRLTVRLSTQACHEIRREIARRWRLPADGVHVLCPFVGGAFGAKSELTGEAVAAIELARSAGRPVRVVLSREEELAVGGFRPGADLELTAVDRSAKKVGGLLMTSHGDAGVAVGSSLASLFRLSYRFPLACRSLDVVTNGPPGKPFRGPGGPPALWALEQMVDEMAHRLGVDPIDLRLRQVGTENRRRLLEWASAQPVWRQRPPVAADRGRFRRGVGFAASLWPYFVDYGVRVRISAGAAGISVSTASQDMGNGTRTILAGSVAEVLGLNPHEIEVRLGDSARVRGPTSSASRTTASLEPAAVDAARELRRRLCRVARRRLGLRRVRPAGDGVDHAAGHTSWQTILESTEEIRVERRRRWDRFGTVLPFRIPVLGAYLGLTWSGGAQITEVEVDTLLGRVRVTGGWSRFASGRIVSPTLARSQAEGGFIQGIGYALYEERRRDPATGRVLSANLQDYKIPGIGDVPEIEISFDERGFGGVRGGGIGLAEVTTLATAASIGNAVFHATGWRPSTLPLRPDRILAGLGR